ncbi:retrovirus-related pol polyprotein from transposon TNT 1-94 [Tanacetum coccineum]
MTLDIHNWSSSAHQELQKIIKDEIFPNVNQVDARVQNFEIQILKEAAKFVQDFKSLTKEANESLGEHKALEYEIERLLRVVVSQDIMSIVQSNFVVDTSNLHTELERTKERFENYIIKKENEYAKLWNDWINPSKTSRVDNVVPNKPVKARVSTKLIIVSQPHVITKKYVNFDSNGLSSIGVNNTTQTRRPHPRSNTKNDKVPSLSKSSCIENKEVKVEEHHRNLLLSTNKKHMSSECNNIKLTIQNDKSEVVCAMCKQCLIIAYHDVCVLKWSPTGRMFDLKGKIFASSKSECQFNSSRGHSNLFMVRRLGMLKAYDRKFEASYKFLLKVSQNGLGYNLFSIGQFCDSNLEVSFRRNTCFVRNLKGVDLLKGNRTTNLYTINLHEMSSASPICFIARATSTKSWLWHQRLSHVNFDTINDLAKNDLVTGLPKFKYHKEHLCPSCEQGKSKKASHPPKPVPNLKSKDEAPEERLLLCALCYPKNHPEDIGKLGAKGDIGFFIGYSATSCAYIVYNRMTKKIMKTMNVTFDELLAMAFQQRISKSELQGMTSRQISSVLDLTYASSTITSQKPTECELDLLFEAMYDDYIGGQPSATPRTTPASPAPQVL